LARRNRRLADAAWRGQLPVITWEPTIITWEPTVITWEPCAFGCGQGWIARAAPDGWGRHSCEWCLGVGSRMRLEAGDTTGDPAHGRTTCSRISETQRADVWVGSITVKGARSGDRATAVGQLRAGLGAT